MFVDHTCIMPISLHGHHLNYIACILTWPPYIKACHMDITCTSHGRHMLVTWTSYACWTSHTYHMDITCLSHDYSMDITCYHMDITCLSYGYYMIIAWISHAYHMDITCLSHGHCMHECSVYMQDLLQSLISFVHDPKVRLATRQMGYR